MENAENATELTTNQPEATTDDPFLSALGISIAGQNDADGHDDADDQAASEADKPTKAAQKDDGEDYVIRYKGKEETLHRTRDEVIADLQKARDYDAVRAERDALRKSAAETGDDTRILEHIARENDMSLQQYRAYMKDATSDAAILNSIRDKYGEMSDAAAKAILEAEKAKLSAAETAKAEEAAGNEIKAALAEYPDMDINKLPSDVQADMADGMSLLEALRMHDLRECKKQIAEFKAQIDAHNKKQEIRFRNPGSAYSQGAAGGVDAFLKGFAEGG